MYAITPMVALHEINFPNSLIQLHLRDGDAAMVR